MESPRNGVRGTFLAGGVSFREREFLAERWKLAIEEASGGRVLEPAGCSFESAAKNPVLQGNPRVLRRGAGIRRGYQLNLPLLEFSTSSTQTCRCWNSPKFAVQPAIAGIRSALQYFSPAPLLEFAKTIGSACRCLNSALQYYSPVPHSA